MERDGRKTTIGFLISGITDKYTESVCRGILHAAREAGVNLVVIPGKYLDRGLSDNPADAYEYQFNTLFSYARQDNLDGLVIAADCIGCLTTRENVVRLLESYKGIPSVLLASKIDGYVSVNYDNDYGIREGLEYLIREQHCKKIGMIGGPVDNTDAQERKKVFMEVMEKHGLPVEERFYVEGNLSAYDNVACGKMLDDNPDVEAIFCVNDDTAMYLYVEMEKRNLVPGRDIKVFGYDDTIYAAKAKPSLASVCANPTELGKRAVEMVLQMLAGEEIASEVLKTKLIKRNSIREATAGSEQEQERLLDENRIDEYFESIFYRYQYQNVDNEISAMQKAFKATMQKIFQLFRSPEPEEQISNEIVNLFDVFLDYDAVKYADVDNLVAYLKKVHTAMKSTKEGTRVGYELGKVFSIIYQKIIYSLDYRIGIISGENGGISSAVRLFARDIMQFDRGNDQSYTMLLGNLEWMDIHNAYIYTFKEPLIHLYKEKFIPPENYYLKAALVDGKVRSIPATRQKKKISELFCNKAMNSDRYSLVMLPLFFNEMLYGFLLCDMTEAIYENGDFLTNQMSSAVKMIATLRMNEQIQQQLEESLVTLRENNIELDNLSKSDGLTGILNRRGFYDAAEKVVAHNKETGKRTMVAYIDMNNLKIINDRYGHDEGDFSLKLIADLLGEMIGADGVIGRIGGDEFACAIPYSLQDEGKEVVKQFSERFKQYNQDSLKPYNITISTGVYVFESTSKMSLKEALSLADERLYIAKQSRVKVVAK